MYSTNQNILPCRDGNSLGNHYNCIQDEDWFKLKRENSFPEQAGQLEDVQIRLLQERNAQAKLARGDADDEKRSTPHPAIRRLVPEQGGGGDDMKLPDTEPPESPALERNNSYNSTKGSYISEGYNVPGEASCILRSRQYPKDQAETACQKIWDTLSQKEQEDLRNGKDTDAIGENFTNRVLQQWWWSTTTGDLEYAWKQDFSDPEDTPNQDLEVRLPLASSISNEAVKVDITATSIRIQINDKVVLDSTLAQGTS